MCLVRDILLKQASSRPKQLAVEDPQGSCTYKELHDAAMAWAQALHREGVKSGDRCLVVLPNGIEFVQAHFSVQYLGAISVPCDAAIKGESLLGILRSAKPVCILTDTSRYEALKPVFEGMDAIKILLVDAETGIDTCLSGPALLKEGAGRFCLPDIDPQAVASLMYTTGTTSDPKGVILTHLNILKALKNICEFVGYSEMDREVVILPLSHNFGLGHVYCNLMSGGSVYVENGLARPGRVLKAVKRFQATGFPCTPMGIGLLIDQYGPVVADKFSKLRFSVINSAPLPPKRAAQLQQLLPNLEIMVYYGLTEASRSTFFNLSQAGADFYRSVGPAMPGVTLRTVNEDGLDVARGEVGEILIHGETVTQGYWGDESATAEVLQDGWLHTGDLGSMDQAGRLYVVGRLKDQINIGGYKVNPDEVEKMLAAFGGMKDLAVAGVSDDGANGGEEIMVAALLPEEGVEIDLDALDAHCVKHLERFKVPGRYVLVSSIPRTTTGKLKRAELTEVLKKEIVEPC